MQLNAQIMYLLSRLGCNCKDIVFMCREYMNNNSDRPATGKLSLGPERESFIMSLCIETV